jgi:hypothetical protein
MKRIAFLGPTIPRPRLVGAEIEIRPPVKQGDVLRALADGATHLGIVDGYFDQVPSVWHKEILFAMEQGAVVYGASSMGALRAAELDRFGMIGVGRIYEMYASGELVDDDEVALLHGPASSGYMSISEAMINLRDRLDAAVAKSLVTRAEADHAAATLKALPYSMRSVRKLGQLLPALDDFLKTAAGPSLKERDAILLLERMMMNAPSSEQSKRPKVERTVFLERLRLEVMREKNDPAAEELAERVIAVEAREDDRERLAAAFPQSRFS